MTASTTTRQAHGNRRTPTTRGWAVTLAAVAGVVAAAALAPLAAQDRTRDADVERGAEVYAAQCAYCHDRVPEGTALAMLPAPASLTLKYGGALSPYIKERRDLASAATLGVFLRNGAGSMPPFRKTEVTDTDVAALAAYFRRTSAEAAESGPKP